MPVERNNIKLCHDVIFKGIFLREKELLLKMIYDITNITETMQYEEILTGYELEPYKVNGKVNKSDMLIKINDRYFINVELNYKHQKNVLVRNMIQLFRICGQVLESGMTDNELSLIKVGQLNFNTFSNSNDKVLERVFYTNEEGEIISNLLNIWNIDIEKCYKTLYNNSESEEKLPKVVKWGAIIYSDLDKMEETLKRIGDLLTMEEKEKLLKRIHELMKDRKIIQEWMVIENNRLREEDILNTAKGEARREGWEEGIEDNKIELIKKMLIKKYSYDDISEITGKTIDEIKEIEKSIE